MTLQNDTPGRVSPVNNNKNNKNKKKNKLLPTSWAFHEGCFATPLTCRKNVRVIAGLPRNPFEDIHSYNKTRG